MSDSPFSILNIKENASFDEIKSAYRKLSMINHPDRNPNNAGANKIFQDINNAYQLLTANNSFSGYSLSNNNLQSPNSQSNNPVNISPSAPPPIIVHLEIDFYKIFTGCSEPIHISRWYMNNNTKIDENETIYITIPSGTDDNEIFIIKNKGNILENNIKGDIKVFIKIINNTLYKRQGLDIIYNKHISLKDALCGFSFYLTFLDGKNYKINNQSGNVIAPNYKKIINKMGLTRGKITGNLIIEFFIDFPKSLSIDTIRFLKNNL